MESSEHGETVRGAKTISRTAPMVAARDEPERVAPAFGVSAFPVPSDPYGPWDSRSKTRVVVAQFLPPRPRSARMVRVRPPRLRRIERPTRNPAPPQIQLAELTTNGDEGIMMRPLIDHRPQPPQ